MIENGEQANRILEHFVELLDIPEHYYELAKQRYVSLADWFHREASKIAQFDPAVYPQGSFRLGTVIRSLSDAEEYDLDLVSVLTLLSKSDLNQADLKQLVGEEVRAYARAMGVKDPVVEKARCWRLEYADEVRFHVDILPAVPDDEGFKRLLMRQGIPEDQADHALAITDKTRSNYTSISDDWPRSNPKGYALWFEQRMKVVAQQRRLALVEKRVYASVDDVPAYEWKTPLQRAIQILKRHRDVMFRDQPELKPISIIVSTLAAEAYEGEDDLYSTLENILDRMPGLINTKEPRVPNPVDRAEDFADKWKSDPRLEKSFYTWHQQACTDARRLAGTIGARGLAEVADTAFGINLSDVRCRAIAGEADAPIAAPSIIIDSVPRPWRQNG